MCFCMIVRLKNVNNLQFVIKHDGARTHWFWPGFRVSRIKLQRLGVIHTCSVCKKDSRFPLTFIIVAEIVNYIFGIAQSSIGMM